MSGRALTLPPLNPVLARELKQRMRGRHVWMVVTLYLAVLAVILRWVYVAASQDETFGFDGTLLASASVGRAIFQWLLFFMLLLVCFIVPGLTAGAISGERERQTLISLQITLLRPRSIVVGKLLASLAFVVLLILASLPLLSVPFLVGGVSLGEVVRGLVMVLATAVTLACVSLACSALLRRTQAATVVAYGITLAMVLGTLMVYGAQQIPSRATGGDRPEPWILALNPFAATADVVEGRTPSDGFESPFRVLHDLLVLDEEERLSRAFSGPAGRAFVEGPNGVMIAPAPMPTFVERGPIGGPGGPADMIGGGFSSDVVTSDDAFLPGGGDDEVQARVGGVRFWVMSLWVWFVVALVGVAATIRRISLPKSREST
jgi:ABC-type transport system involved in multi-copper enzyme maturation permease subunit